MGNVYTPRKASKRWLEGAPDYVLDVFDDRKSGDRYTVFLTGQFLVQVNLSRPRSYGNTYVPYLGMSGAPTHPQGVSQWGELDAFQASDYRRRNGKKRVHWLDLPESVRTHVMDRCKEDA